MYKSLFYIFGFFWMLAFIIGQCQDDTESLAYSDSEDYDEYIGTHSIKNSSIPIEENDVKPILEVDSSKKTKRNRMNLQDLELIQEIDSNAILQKEKLEIPRYMDLVNEQILVRYGYITSYNNITKCPNWVAWCLTKEHTSGEWSRQGIPYIEDTEAIEPRQKMTDWRINPQRYDHGHMCPAADNQWSDIAMEQSFYLTNMCPQNSDLNRDEWADLEKECRKWANIYGELFIVCGPIFYNGKNQTIGGPKEIWVPDAFFKVILTLSKTPKAIGFIYPNDYIQGSIKQFVYAVDEVEKVTALDFYFNLPDEIEERIESYANLTDW